MTEPISDKNYEAEKRFLSEAESKDPAQKRTCLNEAELKKIKDEYPEISDDYLLYLREIGCGAIMDCSFIIYSGPMTLDSLGLAESYPVKENVIFFGDNFAGDMAGFNVDNKYSVVVLRHESGKIHESELSFREFIRKEMGMGRSPLSPPSSH